jgi:hypothetical protein
MAFASKLVKEKEIHQKWIWFVFLSSILLFLHLLTCVYIVFVTSPLIPSPSSQNLFHPPVPQFFWKENIRVNKKDIVFLLVWNKDFCYTERFLVLLPCTCVLQPTLVHLCQTSSLLPGTLPKVASASLRLLYLLLYSELTSHIQVLGFLPLPYYSHVHSPLSVTHVQ